MRLDDNIIYVRQLNDYNALVEFKGLKCEAFIGKNGTTIDKIEGDNKTPIGEFELGMAFGLHDIGELKFSESIKYVKLTDSMYWVSDYMSKYYNRFVNNVDNKDWNEAEHLVDYKVQYEYAIEIKANPKNIPKRGSAIFLHCSNGGPTARMRCCE